MNRTFTVSPDRKTATSDDANYPLSLSLMELVTAGQEIVEGKDCEVIEEIEFVLDGDDVKRMILAEVVNI